MTSQDFFASAGPTPDVHRDSGVLLKISGLSVDFKGVRAVDKVSFSLPSGGSLALIGPNGAGKTTLLNAISRLVRPSEGEIVYRGAEITTVPAWRSRTMGIARTFQDSRLCPELTVLDQVLSGDSGYHRYGLGQALLRSGRFLRAEANVADRSREILGLFGLSDMLRAYPSELPSAHRRLVDLARALVSETSLLLLDEIGAGLDKSAKLRLAGLLSDLRRERKLTLIVVEHDMDFVRAVCDRCVALDHGRLVTAGSVDEVLTSASVALAYIGGDL